MGRINGRYSTADFTPIHYLNNKNLSLDEICALYMAADAGILTPLRDGMNLTCAHRLLLGTLRRTLLLT